MNRLFEKSPLFYSKTDGPMNKISPLYYGLTGFFVLIYIVFKKVINYFNVPMTWCVLNMWWIMNYNSTPGWIIYVTMVVISYISSETTDVRVFFCDFDFDCTTYGFNTLNIHYIIYSIGVLQNVPTYCVHCSCNNTFLDNAGRTGI